LSGRDADAVRSESVRDWGLWFGTSLRLHLSGRAHTARLSLAVLSQRSQNMSAMSWFKAAAA